MVLKVRCFLALRQKYVEASMMSCITTFLGGKWLTVTCFEKTELCSVAAWIAILTGIVHLATRRMRQPCPIDEED